MCGRQPQVGRGDHNPLEIIVVLSLYRSFYHFYNKGSLGKRKIAHMLTSFAPLVRSPQYQPVRSSPVLFDDTFCSIGIGTCNGNGKSNGVKSVCKGCP